MAIVGLAVVAVVAIAIWLMAGRSQAPRVPAAPVPTVRTTTIGSSENGVAIKAYAFGHGANRYLVVGGIHGNEYGAAVGEGLVARLQADPSLVPTGTQLVVVPVLNPDGRAADTRANANGVDLNRNFPSENWSSVLARGDSSAKQGLNGGTQAGSEPETKAIMACLEQGFTGVMSLHSKGGIVDYDGPGGAAVAKRVSTEIQLPVKHLSYQPSVRGSMGLYVPETYHIPVITLELNSESLTDPVLRGILAGASKN